MPEMHLRQPGFTYSACGPFTKRKQRIYFLQHDVAYSDSKNLAKVLKVKVFKIASNPK